MQEHRSLDMEADRSSTPPPPVLVFLKCSVVAAHPQNNLGEALVEADKSSLVERTAEKNWREK